MIEPPEDAEPWQKEAWNFVKMSAEFGSEIGLWAQAPMIPEKFEAAILAACDHFERRMGVRPTVIDLPNWVRATILEQIAFTNGFTIADRRTN